MFWFQNESLLWASFRHYFCVKYHKELLPKQIETDQKNCQMYLQHLSRVSDATHTVNLDDSWGYEMSPSNHDPKQDFKKLLWTSAAMSHCLSWIKETVIETWLELSDSDSFRQFALNLPYSTLQTVKSELMIWGTHTLSHSHPGRQTVCC